MAEQGEDLQAIGELLASGHPQEAVARLAPYLSQRPDDAQALCLMAECQLRLGSAGGALAAAQQAVGRDPQLGRAHLIGSLAASRLGQVPVALAAAQEAVRLLPNDAEAWVQLSVAARAAGKNATAVDAADRAAKLAPSDPNAARALNQALGGISGSQQRVSRERLSRSIVVLFVAGILLAGIGAGEWRSNLKTASSCAQSLAGGTCSGYTGVAVLGVIVLAIGLVLLVVAVFRWLRWRSVP